MNIANDSSYYIGGIMSLHLVTIKPNVNTMKRDHDLSFLSLSGCGVDIGDEEIIASGDLTGKILFWKSKENLPVGEVINPSSSPTRCLLWINNGLLIGTLEGELFFWKGNFESISSNKNLETMKLLYHFLGGVVTIRADKENKRIAVGTTTGDLHAFDVLLQSDGYLQIQELFHVQAHKPKLQSDGSMLNMEIWSLIWSVDDKFIATTSEDQTTIISDSLTGREQLFAFYLFFIFLSYFTITLMG